MCTSMLNQPAKALQPARAACQMQSEPLKGLMPTAPFRLIAKGQQLVGSETGQQPSLFHNGDSLDACIHDLWGTQRLTADESQEGVWLTPTH